LTIDYDPTGDVTTNPIAVRFGIKSRASSICLLAICGWACDVVRSQAVPVIIKSPEKLCLAQRNREPIIIMFAHRGFMVRSEAVAFSAISMG
jgi:hypothetical protein